MKKAPGVFAPVITVDRQAGVPLHRQIYEAYRTMITEGNLRTGQQILSTRALALELGISRIPVLNAYEQLLAEGYFESRVGDGTFVSKSLPDQLTSCRNGIAKADGEIHSGSRPVSRQAALLPKRESAPWIRGRGAFGVGQLALEHFPLRTWSTLIGRYSRSLRQSSLTYGDPMGYDEFREAIAVYLRTARAVRCEAGQIIAVSGSQQALDITARVLLNAGSRVWMEDPGYWLMKNALSLSACQPIPVPVDDEGLIVSAGIRRSPKARAAYVTPSHQFPLGVTMSASRRLQLLEWAQTSSAWIVEDDYDSEFRYESKPIASLQGLDRNSRVIYVGTFSKSLFPSLRLGYIVIPSDLVDRFQAVRFAMDVCAPQIYQAVLAEFINEGHFSRHIRRMRLIYGERRSELVKAIRKEFGSAVQIVGAEAGMHLTVMLPKNIPDVEVAERAAGQNLRLWPLSPSYLGPRARSGFILGFGSTSPKDMPNAVRQLGRLLRPYLTQ